MSFYDDMFGEFPPVRKNEDLSTLETLLVVYTDDIKKLQWEIKDLTIRLRTEKDLNHHYISIAEGLREENNELKKRIEELNRYTRFEEMEVANDNIGSKSPSSISKSDN